MIEEARRRGSGIRYAWALRVPVLAAVALLALPIVAFSTGARPFLSGLFDPIAPRALLLITPLALFNAWTTVIIAALILTYGEARLDLPAVRFRFFPVGTRVWIWSALLAVPVVATTAGYMTTASDHRFDVLAVWAAAGAALSGALLFGTIRLTGLAAKRGERWRQRDPPSPLARIYERILTWLAAHPAFGAGFIERRDGILRLAEGHGLALGIGWHRSFSSPPAGHAGVIGR